MITALLRPDVTAQLGFYVYRLVNPGGVTFYVGKGTGGRVHEHRGRTDFPTLYEERIVQWGLSEADALRLEAALIAVLDPPLNRVAGHGATDCDLRTDTLQARLGASLFDVSGIPDGILIVQVRGGVYYPYPGAKPCRHPSFEDIAAQGEAAVMARVQGDWTCGAATARRHCPDQYRRTHRRSAWIAAAPCCNTTATWRPCARCRRTHRADAGSDAACNTAARLARSVRRSVKFASAGRPAHH